MLMTILQYRELKLKKEREEEAKRLAGPKPIVIHVFGKLDDCSMYSAAPSAPAVTTTVTIQPEEGESVGSRILSLERQFRNPTAVALYNPQTTEIFKFPLYTFSEGGEIQYPTFADIDRLGAEGTVWQPVYEGFWNRRGENFSWRSPTSNWLIFGAWRRAFTGQKTVPSLLMKDLEDGYYFGSWKSVWDFHRCVGHQSSLIQSTVWPSAGTDPVEKS